MSNRNSVHFLCGYILEVFSLSLSPLQSPSLIYHLLSKQEQSLAPYTLLPLASHQHPSLQIKHRVKTHVIGPHLSKKALKTNEPELMALMSVMFDANVLANHHGTSRPLFLSKLVAKYSRLSLADLPTKLGQRKTKTT